MTIQDLGSIGEVVGALATVATLGYLALQIRANTRATLAEARRTTLHHRTSGYSELIANEDFALIFEKGLAGREPLTSTERIRFDFFFSRMLADSDLMVAEQADGLATMEAVEPGIANMVSLLRTPGGRKCWKRLRGNLGADFRKRIDAGLDADELTSSAEPAA